MAYTLDEPSMHSSGTASASLYLSLGADVLRERPIFTGDVFVDVPYLTPQGNSRTRTVMVLQHPCSLREDGVHLSTNVLVAEVTKHPPIDNWQKFTKMMPLPDLFPEFENSRRHRAALFDKLAVVRSDELNIEGRRVACLSQEGVDLLLQRWIFASSRAIVELNKIDEVVAGPFNEAEIIEDWCGAATSKGVALEVAAVDCVGWLREEHGARSRQSWLDEPAKRSAIRRDARELLRNRTEAEWLALADAGESSEVAAQPEAETGD